MSQPPGMPEGVPGVLGRLVRGRGHRRHRGEGGRARRLDADGADGHDRASGGSRPSPTPGARPSASPRSRRLTQRGRRPLAQGRLRHVLRPRFRTRRRGSLVQAIGAGRRPRKRSRRVARCKRQAEGTSGRIRTRRGPSRSVDLLALAASLSARPAGAWSVNALGRAGRVDIEPRRRPALVPVTVIRRSDYGRGAASNRPRCAWSYPRVAASGASRARSDRVRRVVGVGRGPSRTSTSRQLIGAGRAATRSTTRRVDPVSGSAAVDVEGRRSRSSSRQPTRTRLAVTDLGTLEPLVPRSVDLGEARRHGRGPAPAGDAGHERLAPARRCPADVDVDAALRGAARAAASVARVPGARLRSAAAAAGTPNFSSMQGYLRTSARHPRGLLARRTRARAAPACGSPTSSTTGRHDHEDLQLDPVGADLGKTQFPQYTNFADEHGTAVFGEMVAKDNGYGVTGGVPDATMHGISPTRARPTGNGTAVHHRGRADLRRPVPLARRRRAGRAADAPAPRRHARTCRSSGRRRTSTRSRCSRTSGSSSWRPAATATRTSTPRRCWAASTAPCATPARSSAAPATSTNLSALNFSSHGTRVDLQGWGQNITTTGSGGNLFGGTAAGELTRRYTRSFSGTSGAGPIVVNAIVAVQSYLKATGQGVLHSAQMRDLLRRTGTPQTGTRLVGPLPNIEAALKEVEVDAPCHARVVVARGVNGWYLNPTVTLSADDGWGVGVDGDRVPARRRRVDAVHGAVPGDRAGRAHVEYRSTDKKGNVEAVKSPTFNVYDLGHRRRRRRRRHRAGDAGADARARRRASAPSRRASRASTRPRRRRT